MNLLFDVPQQWVLWMVVVQLTPWRWDSKLLCHTHQGGSLVYNSSERASALAGLVSRIKRHVTGPMLDITGREDPAFDVLRHEAPYVIMVPDCRPVAKLK